MTRFLTSKRKNANGSLNYSKKEKTQKQMELEILINIEENIKISKTGV